MLIFGNKNTINLPTDMKKYFLTLAFLCLVFQGFAQKKWTLKECVDHALENNITVKQNELNVELADIDVKNAKGNFLPNLNASSSGGFNFGLRPNELGVLSSNTTFNASFNVNTSVNIFNGYRNLRVYEQAKLGVETSKLSLQKIQNDISLFVVNGYLNVLFSKENLNVAKVQYSISKKQEEAAESRFKAGIAPKSDWLNARSTAANDAQNIVTQENALNLALLNLAQLLQISPENFDIAPVEVGSPSAALLYDTSDMVYQKALTRQPEIKRAELAIEDANLNIEIAKSNFLPSLSFGAGAGSSFFNSFDLLPGQANAAFFTQIRERLGYNVGLSLNIPIFNRNQNKNNLDRSVVNKEISQLRLVNEQLQLQQTIEQAYLDAKAAAKTYEAAKTSLVAQTEAFKNAQESYNFGATTLFDFDLVRNRLVSAEASLIRAKYDYVFKTKVLQFYYGDLIFE